MHKIKVVKEAGDMLRFELSDFNAMLFIRDPWSDMNFFTMALTRGCTVIYKSFFIQNVQIIWPRSMMVTWSSLKLSDIHHVCLCRNKSFLMSFSHQARVAGRPIYHEEKWKRSHHLQLTQRAVHRVVPSLYFLSRELVNMNRVPVIAHIKPIYRHWHTVMVIEAGDSILWSFNNIQ